MGQSGMKIMLTIIFFCAGYAWAQEMRHHPSFVPSIDNSKVNGNQKPLADRLKLAQQATRGCSAVFIVRSTRPVDGVPSLIAAGFERSGDYGCIALMNGDYGLLTYKRVVVSKTNGHLEVRFQKYGNFMEMLWRNEAAMSQIAPVTDKIALPSVQ